MPEGPSLSRETEGRVACPSGLRFPISLSCCNWSTTFWASAHVQDGHVAQVKALLLQLLLRGPESGCSTEHRLNGARFGPPNRGP